MNETWNFTNSEPISKYVSQILYVIAGLVCSLGNLLVILVVFKNRNLHGKIFMLLVNLALADTLKGTAYLVAGSKRIHILMSKNTDLVSPFECMQEFSTTMFILGPQAVNLMSVFVISDRLAAIGLPILYSRLDRKYVFFCVTMCWTLVVASYTVAWVESSRLPRLVKYSKWCVAAWSFSKAYNRFMFGFEAVSTWICLVLLLCTFMAIKYSKSPCTRRPSYYKRQMRISKMIAISSSFVILLWVLPTNIVFIMTLVGRSKWFDIHIAPILWLMVAFSGCTNIFVYAWMNHHIRNGIKTTLRCESSLGKSQNQHDRYMIMIKMSSVKSSGNYQDL